MAMTMKAQEVKISFVQNCQIVREVERDISRREQQQREEQTLINEVGLCVVIDCHLFFCSRKYIWQRF